MFFTLRQAIHALTRAPLVSLVVVTCLGVGTGATTTVYAWIEHLVRRPLPAVANIDELVSVVGRVHGREESVSYPDYVDWRDRSSTLRGIAAFGMRQFAVRVAGEERGAGQPTWGLLTSDNYFELLGVLPAAGRSFTAGECRAAGHAPVAVVSHAVAQRFGGAQSALGRELRINDTLFTIVGVAPVNFGGTYAGLTFDIWVPITMQPLLGGDATALESRDARWLQIIGRRRERVSLAEARAELAAIGARIAETHREAEGRDAFVRPLDTGAARRLSTLFTVLLGMTALITLIVCANVASLLMLRGAARAGEIGIRLSLGASRAHVVAQLLVESVLLAAAGAAFGLFLARWMQGVLPALMPASPLPLTLAAPLNARTTVFAMALAAAMVLVFGLAPAMHTLRRAVLPNVSRSRTDTTRGGTRVRAWLVVAQLALSMAALAAAGAFLRVNAGLAAIDRGLREPAQVLVVSTDLEQAGYNSPEWRVQATERLLGKVRALTGVDSAAFATFVPLGFTGYSAVTVSVPGYTPRADEDMAVLSNRVSGDYFRTLGIPIREGRPIDDRDVAGAAPALIVNEAFARRFMSEASVIGREILVGSERAIVVGIAADGKYQFDALDKPSPPHVYLAYAQHSRAFVTLHVRTVGPPQGSIADLRHTFAAINPALPLNSPTTLDDYTSLPLFPVRLGTTVLALLGGVALLLAAAGLYGVLAYRVSQRRREIAVRVAIGASPRAVVRLVLGDATWQVVAGVSIGTLLGLMATRVISGRLQRIVAVDPAVLALAAGVLTTVALLAAVVPALRAARVDPSIALRSE
jgi:predicted permease